MQLLRTFDFPVKNVRVLVFPLSAIRRNFGYMSTVLQRTVSRRSVRHRMMNPLVDRIFAPSHADLLSGATQPVTSSDFLRCFEMAVVTLPRWSVEGKIAASNNPRG
ncbi:hypothetical protein [Lacunimicrobium album]